MKFLLVAVNAKFIHSNPAIRSMAAYAIGMDAGAKEHIDMAEYTINHPVRDVLYDIYAKKPDVIGFSCYIWNISYIEELCPQVKKVLPDVRIWLGGPEVSYNACELLRKRPFLTGIMIGEGEQTFSELLSYYRKREDGTKEPGQLNKIRGLVLQAGIADPDLPAATGERPLLALSDIPFPYGDLSQLANRIVYYESSRGCPFRCSYCLSSIDKRVRLRDMELVKKELDFFLEQKALQVKFVDRTFNCNKEHAMQIWRYLSDRDNGVTNFHFEVAGDILDEEELSLLGSFRPGAVQLEIGVQSTNPETLRQIKRSTDLTLLKNAVARIKSGGNVHIHLDLIAGLPCEDYASFGESFNEVYAMQPDQLQLGFLKVLKGSAMHERSAEYGLVYSECPPYEVLRTDWMGYDEIHRLGQIAQMVEIYYNSNQFQTTLRLVMPHFPAPFAFFEALSSYYEKMGYFCQSPARSRRYEILLSFLKDYQAESGTKKPEALLTEALTMDLYLRENMKTRPAFCRDAFQWREEARAFFRKEAAEHAVLGETYREADARALAGLTHIERFDYDLETGQKREKPVLCLFDYKTRNPLTRNAAVFEID